MPVHDWSRYSDANFHSFHQSWIPQICKALNQSVLPRGYLALPERGVKRLRPDISTIPVDTASASNGHPNYGYSNASNVALAEPTLKAIAETESGLLAARASSAMIRSDDRRDLFAMIEIVSPGNKYCASRRDAFIDKIVGFLLGGVHVLIVDLFPRGKYDPDGVHAALPY